MVEQICLDLENEMREKLIKVNSINKDLKKQLKKSQKEVVELKQAIALVLEDTYKIKKLGEVEFIELINNVLIPQYVEYAKKKQSEKIKKMLGRK